MRWKGRRQSSNVEDRRGESVPTGRRGMNIAGGAGIAKILFSLLSRSSGKTRIVIILIAVIGFFLFKDKLGLMSGQAASSGGAAQTEQQNTKPLNDEQARFLKVMVGANEDVWKKLLPDHYRPAKLYIYTKAVRMKDGNIADAGMGPFYYPSEEGIYIDPSFFRELATKYKADGDFANAYVVAHEYGHHIQNLLGLTDWLHKNSRGLSKQEYNQKSVRLELHADFLAGIFAHYEDKKFNSIDSGDIQEAIRCAKAIGDDNLQRKATGSIRPEHFTHGTSEQRAKWFMRGYTSGDLGLGKQIYTMPYNQL